MQDITIFYGELSALQLFLVIPRSFDPAVPDTIKALLATTLVRDQLWLQPPLLNLVWTVTKLCNEKSLKRRLP